MVKNDVMSVCYVCCFVFFRVPAVWYAEMTRPVDEEGGEEERVC